jgi:hypothetical protein
MAHLFGLAIAPGPSERFSSLDRTKLKDGEAALSYRVRVKF